MEGWTLHSRLIIQGQFQQQAASILHIVLLNAKPKQHAQFH